MRITEATFNVNIDFETIRLPPVTDILILGKKVPQGKFGVLHSFELISPDVFELLEIPDTVDKNVEAVIINKSILKKVPKETVIDLLSKYVFPYVVKGESLKVNFDVHIFHRNIKGELFAG